MRRHIAKPLNTRGLEADIGIKPASHGMVNDGLPLFLSSASHLHNFRFDCVQTVLDRCQAILSLFERMPNESNCGYHPLPVYLANRRYVRMGYSLCSYQPTLAVSGEGCIFVSQNLDD